MMRISYVEDNKTVYRAAIDGKIEYYDGHIEISNILIIQ